MLESDLESLGPFARALHEILSGAEGRKPVSQKIQEGNHKDTDIVLRQTMGNFSGIFLLYVGAKMKPNWIEQWIDKKVDHTAGDISEQYIKLPCHLNCSENLENALGFAFGGL